MRLSSEGKANGGRLAGDSRGQRAILERSEGTRWDPALVALAVYIAVSIGRIHQLIPALEVLRLGLVSGGIAVGLIFVSRNPQHVWPQLDRTLRVLIVGLLVWSLFSVPMSIYPGLSFRVWRDVVVQSTGLALVTAIAVRDESDARRLLSVFIGSIAFYAVTIIQTFGLDLDVRLGALFSYDTNDFAQVLVCAIPLCIYMALQSRRAFTRLAYWSIVALFLLVLIKTGSRGGFLGLVAVGAVALISWRAVKWQWRFSALLAGAVFFVIFGSSAFWERMASIGDVKSDYNVTSESGRIQAWKRGVGYMLDNPVLGVGVGAFGIAEGTISELAIQRATQSGPGVKWGAAHNSFVEIGAETGLPGLVLFCGMFVLMIQRTYNVAEGRWGGAGGRGELLGGALLLSLVGFYVTAFFLSQAYSPILLFLAGLVAGLWRFDPAPSRGQPALARRGHGKQQLRATGE